MTVVCQAVILGAIFATANIQPTEKVTLRGDEASGSCPGDILTLKCTVHSDVLEWHCAEGINRQIACSDSNILPKTCYDQTLTPEPPECNPDRTVITSVATINISFYNTTWTCMNPLNPSLNKSLTVTVEVPPAVILRLNSTRRYTENFGIAAVSWQETTNVRYHNQTYNITVEPATQQCNSSCVTTNESIELILAIDTEYNVTIITEACNGKLKSAKTKPLSILLTGMSDECSSAPERKMFLLVLLLGAGVIFSPLLLCCCLKWCWGKKNLPGRAEAGRSVVHEGKLYFAAYESSQICCYSVKERRWTVHGKSMHFINFGLAIIDEYVATIGGHKNNKPTNEVWVWENQKWVKYKSMKYKKSDPAVLTVTRGDKKYVIVISGNSHISFALPWTSFVEVYDMEKKKWTEVCRLPSPYPRVEVTLCQDTIFVFPDQYQTGCKCSLEDLIQSTENQNIWKPIKNFPLRYSTPATLADGIVCFGGADRTRNGKTDIYEYNVTKNSWKLIGHLRGVGRMYTMVEVIENECFVVGGIIKLTDDRDPSQRLETMDIISGLRKSR